MGFRFKKFSSQLMQISEICARKSVFYSANSFYLFTTLQIITLLSSIPYLVGFKLKNNKKLYK